MAKDYENKKNNLLEEKVINIGRVTKVTQGGRHFRFSATVAVGNRRGLVGIGTGKANEVNDAIAKASKAANKNVIRVALQDNRTIPVPFLYFLIGYSRLNIIAFHVNVPFQWLLSSVADSNYLHMLWLQISDLQDRPHLHLHVSQLPLQHKSLPELITQLSYILLKKKT